MSRVKASRPCVQVTFNNSIGGQTASVVGVSYWGTQAAAMPVNLATWSSVVDALSDQNGYTQPYAESLNYEVRPAHVHCQGMPAPAQAKRLHETPVKHRLACEASNLRSSCPCAHGRLVTLRHAHTLPTLPSRSRVPRPPTYVLSSASPASCLHLCLI